MDQEDFIKIEHQSPMKTTPNLVNYYMTQFYDHDSAEENQVVKKEDFHLGDSNDPDELLQKLGYKVDLRTMSVEQIIAFAKENYNIEECIDWQKFETKLRKTKIILKRHHAKNREQKPKNNEYYVISDTVEGVNIKQQIQAEIKKKRNRMSAQISRDRRKMKIQELQYNNEKLKAETKKIMQENEKLKKQLQEFNNVQQKKFQVSKGKNKFLSFIIMLGMFFLLTILKENTKTIPLGKITRRLVKTQNQIYSAQEQYKAIEVGQKAFKDYQLMGQPLLGNGKVMRNVMDKLQEMKLQVQDVQIPKSLKRQLTLIKKQIS